MNKSALFYKYYDLLFSSKDYAAETKIILDIASQYRPFPVTSVIEVGCGTGNHTLEIARHVEQVTAIDCDEQMLMYARAKLSAHEIRNVNLVLGLLEDMPIRDETDAVLALFNVITYIATSQQLLKFFQSVRTHLKPNGIFIFDCWNGLAAIKDPPQNKTIQYSDQSQSIVCELTSETDLWIQKTRLTYHLKICNDLGKLMGEGTHSFDQTLWTPMQITSALKESHLEIKQIIRPFIKDAQATESDWKLMFICQAENIRC
jgi:ubiquinone/menaquinone biosynthesis C-methylase UbiE